MYKEQSPRNAERSHIIKEQIIQRIRQDGPITFADFMQETMYGEYGFFSSDKAKLDETVDFLLKTTSPEKGPVFAHTIADAIKDAWDEMGNPGRFDFVEMGAGTGQFARDFINRVKNLWPDFYDCLRYTIVEISPSLASLQQEKLTDSKVDVIVASAANLPISEIEGVFFSNELLDNLPFHRIVYKRGKLREIFVGESNGQLIDKEGSPSRDFKKHLKMIDFRPEENTELHISLTAIQWLHQINRSLKRGHIIAIDYGDKADKVHSSENWMHKMAVDNINSVMPQTGERYIYEWLGDFDLTTFVDFTSLEKTGQRLGLQGDVVPQPQFLQAIGIKRGLIEKLLINDRNAVSHASQIDDLMSSDRFKVLVLGKKIFEPKKFSFILQDK